MYCFKKLLMIFHREPVAPAVPAGENQAVRAAAVGVPIAAVKRGLFSLRIPRQGNAGNFGNRQRAGRAKVGANHNCFAVERHAAAKGESQLHRDQAKEQNSPSNQKISLWNRRRETYGVMSGKAECKQPQKQRYQNIRDGAPEAQVEFHDASPLLYNSNQKFSL